jgi:hypothetical protein
MLSRSSTQGKVEWAYNALRFFDHIFLDVFHGEYMINLIGKTNETIHD